ncbi:extracellular solute-binding protein [uncultured Leifsonia sp.]|uniref:extracellular solute-binding protein n=1 Tax=uncultured Leifsonia sp. TaxID=340359 RepID=UPI0025E96B8F|nr:extracellular solute-binding protein [uncultured Leifsonia sp.]
MKNKVTIAAAAALAAGALLLTGCSSGATSASSAPLASAGAKKISGTVTFWDAYSSDSPEVSTLEKVIIPAFEKLHPGVTVKDVAVPYNDLHQKLVTAVAGDQLPDLVRADIIWVPELANLGVLEPLDTDMPDFKTLAGETYPGSLATNKWKGHYYGLPLDTNTRVMLYNQQTLQNAGITAAPTTLDQMMADGAALKAKGDYVYADGGTSGWNVLPFIWSAGGDITNSGYTKATGYMNSPTTVKVVQEFVDMYKQGYIPNIVLGTPGGLGTEDGLAKGTYASLLDGPWAFPILQSQYPKFQIQTAPVPSGAAGSVSVVGGEDVVLTKSSQNKDAAAEFMRYLLSPAAQLAMAKVGQMPVLSNLGSQLTTIQSYYAPFQKQLKDAKPRPVTPAETQIDTILQNEITSALKGQITVQKAMDSAASQTDVLLAKYSK